MRSKASTAVALLLLPSFIDAFAVQTRTPGVSQHFQPIQSRKCLNYKHGSRRRRSSLAISNSNESRDEDTVSQQSTVFPDLPGGVNYLKAGVASVWLALALFAFPFEAQAGFGPSGGATTTPAPGVSKVKVEDLSSKKLQQLIDNTIDENRLIDFQAQLDALIENLANTLNQVTSDEESAGSVEGDDKTSEVRPPPKPQRNPADEVQLEKAKNFQAQIKDRERILDKLESQPWWFNYLAAFCGSVLSTLVMHPVDTIKTRLQVQSANSTDEEGSQFANLYEGLTGNILKEGPPSALYLGVYESVKSSLLNGKLASVWAGLFGVAASGAEVKTPAYLLTIYLMAGAAGELVGSTVRAPAEAVKSMVQTQSADTTGEAFNLVFGEADGRQNVFRAWSASIFRDVPFGAIQLALFELIKAFILNNPNIDVDSSTLTSEAIIGAFAGGIGAFLTNPTDVITTRIITQSTEEDDEPLGVVQMAKLVFDEGGLGAFFAGWQARVLYWAPAISLFLTCYCSVRQYGVKVDLFP